MIYLVCSQEEAGKCQQVFWTLVGCCQRKVRAKSGWRHQDSSRGPGSLPASTDLLGSLWPAGIIWAPIWAVVVELGQSAYQPKLRSWLFLSWTIPGLFSSLFSFSLLNNWCNFFCECHDSNQGYLVFESTAHSTEPQPLPINFFCLDLIKLEPKSPQVSRTLQVWPGMELIGFSSETHPPIQIKSNWIADQKVVLVVKTTIRPPSLILYYLAVAQW